MQYLSLVENRDLKASVQPELPLTIVFTNVCNVVVVFRNFHYS